MPATYLFISYRREDSAGYSGRLYDRLTQRFGEAQVFLDLEGIPGATDFTAEIREALDRANIVLVIIGPHWLDCTGGSGKIRLREPSDLVRKEVRAALENSVPVIPVLVGGARMPKEADLPHDIVKLHLLNAVEVSDRRFSSDAEILIDTIGRLTQTTVSVTPAAEIHPGHWEICKMNYGMAPVTILLDLRINGTLAGRLQGMGGAVGNMLNSLGGMPDLGNIMGPVTQMLGQIEYSGRWNYDVSSKVLTLELIGQVPGLGGGSEMWQMRITGNDRGVFQAIDQVMMQYTLKRIG